MSAVDIISLTHIAVTTSISVVRLLKQHRDCHHELKQLLNTVEESSDELQSNIMSLKETLGTSAQEPSIFLNNILKKIQKVCSKFASLRDDLNSQSSATTFFKAPGLTAKLEEILEKIEGYDDILDQLGIIATDISNKNAQNAAIAFFETMIARDFDVQSIHYLQSEIHRIENQMRQGDRQEAEIDISEIGQRDPMELLVSSESRAQEYLLWGKFYYEGEELKGKIEKDFTRSFRYFTAALKKGNWQAAFYLGELHYKGLGVTKNYEEAYKLYNVGAKMDDGEALYRVGWCLSCGHGTERNRIEASRYYKLSYDAGSAEGASHQRFYVFYGLNTEPDTKKGYRILTEAKEKGIPDVKLDLASCNELGIEVYERNPEEAFKLTEEAFESGVRWFGERLARYYEEGIGAPRDFREAARLYHDIWKKGGIEAVEAKPAYGWCLIRGRGVEMNVQKGVKLLQQSCTEQSSTGWRRMGDCHRHGYGVEQNFNSAVFHYNAAIGTLGGHEDLIRVHLALGEMHDEGVGLSQMQHNAYYYYNYAAGRSNAEALWKMGLIFEEGRSGIDAHANRAFYYFRLSAQGGYSRGQEKAGEYIIRGQAVERTRISAIDTIEEAADRGDGRARRIIRRME